MSTIPVELPDHLQSYVDESAEQAGFANASEYIVALVAAASQKQREGAARGHTYLVSVQGRFCGIRVVGLTAAVGLALE